MLRIIAVQLLLFLAPFLVFGLYLYFTERRFELIDGEIRPGEIIVPEEQAE